MTNRNLTIVFVKGNRAVAKNQLNDITRYCVYNNLFIEDIIITSKVDYNKDMLKMLQYINSRDKLRHIVALSKDILIKDIDTENILIDLVNKGKVQLHFLI